MRCRDVSTGRRARLMEVYWTVGWMDVQDTRHTHRGKRDGELGHRGPFATVFNLFRCVRAG